MTRSVRTFLFVAITVVALVAVVAYGLVMRGEYDQQRTTTPAAPATSVDDVQAGARILFRHQGRDSEYGTAAMVTLDDPGGARAFTGVACDRIAAWADGASCLRTKRGVVTAYEALELDATWQVTHSHPLPGIPSRTRVSPGGGLVATTSFVSGHSYLTVGFSTATVVRATGDGRSWGNLERFELVIDGEQVQPVDRNVWGVTFVDDQRFYATVGTGGRTWLVEGDLTTRTLTSVVADAECPALSPDGSRVAYKIDVGTGGEKMWGLAVLDLETLERTDLSGGPRGVDDQVAWLDDETLMYGLPRADDPGVTDVWSLGTSTEATPSLLIEDAWSPTVAR